MPWDGNHTRIRLPGKEKVPSPGISGNFHTPRPLFSSRIGSRARQLVRVSRVSAHPRLDGNRSVDQNEATTPQNNTIVTCLDQQPYPTTATRKSLSTRRPPHCPNRIATPARPPCPTLSGIPPDSELSTSAACPKTVALPVTRRKNSALPIAAPSTRYRDFNRSMTNIGNLPPRFRSSHTFRASIPTRVFHSPVLGS